MQYYTALLIFLASAVHAVLENEFPNDYVNSDESKIRTTGHFALAPDREETRKDNLILKGSPRALSEKEKGDKQQHHNHETTLLVDRPLFTHQGLEKIHALPPQKEEVENEDETRKKRHLRQGSHRVTIEVLKTKPVACPGLKKIVQCKDNVPEDTCKEDLTQAGVQVLSDIPETLFFSICVDSEADASIVAELTDVEGVEDDPPRTLSVVEGSTVDRHLQAFQQVIPYGIDLVKAREFWQQYNDNRGAGKKVCVIDTGLRASHEDMQGGDISGSDDRTLVTPWSQDGNSHGSHVAGTIGAQDNSQGVVGVAPDASLHIVRVFDNFGQFSASNLVLAMNACRTAGADIISMSLGGPFDTFAERSAVRVLQNAGILLVAASGNDANGGNLVEYPAGYPEVLSVGAVDRFNQVATFSTHNTAVDIAAPGVDVLSLGSSNDRSYNSKSGTSMACPHVAGVAALVWSQFPNKSPNEIKQALTESARDLGACGKDRLSGHGLVDAVAAAGYLEGNSAAPESGNCVAVNVAITTDDYGSETLYIVTPSNDSSDIVYRGGPYEDGRRGETYRDSFSLPNGCYNIVWFDTVGDGTNDPRYGIGELAVEYGGSRQVSFDDFDGSRQVFRFGSCVAGGPPPPTDTVPPITPPPVPAPTAPPQPRPTPPPQPRPTPPPQPRPTNAPVASPTTPSVCGPNAANLELSLETDRWSRSENHLYLFDTAAPEDEWIWRQARFDLRGNQAYVGQTCLSLSTCNKFYFFDEYGDGLESGGLTLELDGVPILQVLPGDTGEVFEEGESATFWYQEVGNCVATAEADAGDGLR